jgi:glycosyltransferase involved in cell wall biosynthesis
MSPTPTPPSARVAVVIPSYKVRDHVLGVIARIGSEVERIYVVDDACPLNSGGFVEQECPDERVVVIRNAQNLGVGGATMTGYRAAINDGMTVLVKLDGDGQMDPVLIPQIIAPILSGSADYTKGNRFFSPEALNGMPSVRLIGNAGLSFLTKLSSGYWDLLDPTNGFTAIHANVADVLPFDRLAKRYFFESDMLFRLSIVRAVVADIPIFSRYGDEKSNMNAGQVLLPFLGKNLVNTWKRIVYSYFLRGFSFASFQLFFGAILFLWGAGFGAFNWYANVAAGHSTPTGTVMLAVVPLILGFQLILGFIAADIAAVPTRPLHAILSIRPAKPLRQFPDRDSVEAAARMMGQPPGADQRHGPQPSPNSL